MLNIGENVGINQDRITTVTETPQIFSILTELKKKFPLQYITMQWGKLKVGMCWSQGVVLHVVIQAPGSFCLGLSPSSGSSEFVLVSLFLNFFF